MLLTENDITSRYHSDVSMQEEMVKGRFQICVKYSNVSQHYFINILTKAQHVRPVGASDISHEMKTADTAEKKRDCVHKLVEVRALNHFLHVPNDPISRG